MSKAIIAFLTLIIIAFIARLFAPPGAKKLKLEQQHTPLTNKWFSFVAMQYYALIWNRTYKVFVTDEYICGIVVGGAVSAQMVKVGVEFQNPEFYVDPDREQKQIREIESDEFPKKSGANFKIRRDNIERIDYKPKKFGMANIPYSGRIIIVQKNGKKLELILLGKQDYEVIKNAILK